MVDTGQNRVEHVHASALYRQGEERIVVIVLPLFYLPDLEKKGYPLRVNFVSRTSFLFPSRLYELHILTKYLTQAHHADVLNGPLLATNARNVIPLMIISCYQ